MPKVPVDSGSLIIVDPCYISETLSPNLAKVCRENVSEFEFESGGESFSGVFIQGFGGDGRFEVTEERDGNLTKSITVRFTED